MGALLGLAEKVTSKVQKGGGGLLTAAMDGIQRVVHSKKEPLICQALDSLMEHKMLNVTENYLYFDPSPNGESGIRRNDLRSAYRPFRRAIAFVVGGGSYVEMHALQAWAQARGRQVTFGSTDMVAPDQLLQELTC